MEEEDRMEDGRVRDSRSVTVSLDSNDQRRDR